VSTEEEGEHGWLGCRGNEPSTEEQAPEQTLKFWLRYRSAVRAKITKQASRYVVSAVVQACVAIARPQSPKWHPSLQARKRQSIDGMAEYEVRDQTLPRAPSAPDIRMAKRVKVTE
jgi:hypothetical protein